MLLKLWEVARLTQKDPHIPCSPFLSIIVGSGGLPENAPRLPTSAPGSLTLLPRSWAACNSLALLSPEQTLDVDVPNGWLMRRYEGWRREDPRSPSLLVSGVYFPHLGLGPTQAHSCEYQYWLFFPEHELCASYFRQIIITLSPHRRVVFPILWKMKLRLNLSDLSKVIKLSVFK